jgi:tetratricopeptide (TPR) repeat protein
MRPDLDATSADAARAAEAANDAGAEAFRARDFDAAFEYYTEAVRLAPRTVAYLGNQAAAALKVGGGGDTRRERDALTRAVEACVAAVGVDDEYVRGYVRGAKALLVLGDRGDGDVRALRRAREMLERALDVDPAHAGAAATLKDVNVSLQLFDDSDDDA